MSMLAICIYLISFFGSTVEHDIHVGVCDIKVKEEKVQVTVKTFIDDLQIAVGLEPGQPIPDNYTSAEELIAEYITSTIQLKVDEELINLTIADISSSTGDAVWIMIEGVTDSGEMKKLECGFELLTEVYDDQTNIINVYHNNEKEVYSLDTKKISFTYEPE